MVDNEQSRDLSQCNSSFPQTTYNTGSRYPSFFFAISKIIVSYQDLSCHSREMLHSRKLEFPKSSLVVDSFSMRIRLCSLCRIPTVGGKTLDLHLLFVEVTCREGLKRLSQMEGSDAAFNFPTTITSASFVLRKYYLSLLYHFEQAYYFHKEVYSIPVLESTEVQLGCSIMGTIDGKFDSGYLATVNLGSDELKGVLYHAPTSTYVSQSFSDMPTRQNRKRSRLALRDPFRPKSNRRIETLYYGQERAISKKIGYLWNNLTEAEKQVYQDKGMKDKERYRTELLEYKSSYNPTQQ
ncbi:high mobility group B protein 10-like [Pyrus ussuriensis x Pyrus communis]|uniref:High mobility group B protein 10-like n=1 Tax=Pyrus ussuriensis x Pyrus communis TaxID=2448454 RepID=A0A5N5GMH0_9ROSA|nr:high mobility group B protein 10-like [Pyrus ussuriensis x Pyrus communis]